MIRYLLPVSLLIALDLGLWLHVTAQLVARLQLEGAALM